MKIIIKLNARKGDVKTVHFYYYDEDCELDDNAAEKPVEPEEKPIVISLYYFDQVIDE